MEQLNIIKWSKEQRRSCTREQKEKFKRKRQQGAKMYEKVEMKTAKKE